MKVGLLVDVLCFTVLVREAESVFAALHHSCEVWALSS